MAGRKRWRRGLRVTSSGYAQTQGRRYYFGIGSNDYIYHDDANNEFDFVSDGTHRMRLGESVLLDRSNSSFWSLSPPTGTGNDAEWSAAFGYYYLRRNSSTAAEKVNIQTDLEGWLTPEMIDSVVPKMWARTATPDYPEIGPIAEDMDAISPFPWTKGTDADGEVLSTVLTATPTCRCLCWRSRICVLVLLARGG